ncbi:predicted protein [Histoplasma capsulatum H143]|uniref:Uncharacterized protein n=1 Tax=Ajellomyces capsulatus (strain H143) TaxID=544712 RepID=C6HJJ7_AJECH|nr:predicted protein [Histoplasma capsulatum H143]
MVARKPLSPFFCWLQWTLFLNVFIAILPSAPLVIPVDAIARLGKGTGIVEIPECPMGKTQDSPHSLCLGAMRGSLGAEEWSESDMWEGRAREFRGLSAGLLAPTFYPGGSAIVFPVSQRR